MLSLNHLSLRYHTRFVLRDISLTVRPGKVLALIGPNGAGKSSLIRVASGARLPTTGTVTLNGRDLHHLPIEQRARQVAVVPQAVHLPEAFTVLETVLMGRTPYLGWLGRESAHDYRLAEAALDRTCARELAARPMGELSGGEQQRVLIARALAQAAPVLLMDEPTAHLDLRHQTGILTLARDLAQRDNLATLIALHDLNLAATFADEVALLVEGELRALGSPADVLTPLILSAAYGVAVNVITHPTRGTPLVLNL
jgi:iron complex transport system ATP-binding protein